MNAPVATDLAAAHAEIADLRERIDFLEWQALSMSTFAKVMERARHRPLLDGSERA